MNAADSVGLPWLVRLGAVAPLLPADAVTPPLPAAADALAAGAVARSFLEDAALILPMPVGRREHTECPSEFPS